jgi:hypothetical protein
LSGLGFSDMHNSADNTAPTLSESSSYAVLSAQSHSYYELASSYYELASLSNLKLVQLEAMEATATALTFSRWF